MYMIYVKLFAKNEKENWKTLYREDIPWRYIGGIWHRKIYHENKEKQKISNDGGNKTNI